MEGQPRRDKTPRQYAASSTLSKDSISGPQMPDPTNAAGKPDSPPKLKPKRIARDERNLFPSGEPSTGLYLSTNAGSGYPESGRRPQHQQDESDIKYYRVVYRGVVALLASPSVSSPRSGAYLSYGDLIASSSEILENSSASMKSHSPVGNRTLPSMLPHSTDDRVLIRVDRVLTGGYTVDAIDLPVEASDMTPKRGNTHALVSIVGPSPLPLSQPPQQVGNQRAGQEPVEASSHGYVLSKDKGGPILVRVMNPPICEQGNFLYKVVSSAPLPVLTGPYGDAPQTKGMLVPGTIHEVCLRVVDSSVSYLRLTRRRGWVADRRESAQNGSCLFVMKDIGELGNVEECNTSVVSATTSSVATPKTIANRRHRPPRRRREVKKESTEQMQLPRHVPGPGTHQMRHDSQSDVDSQINQSHDRGILMSPSSNISLLSDESSLEHSTSRNAGILTPDRSIARSTASSSVGNASFYLMRVNAPRGLKILDAPHFQVSNLIHGSQSGHASIGSPPKKEVSGKTGNHSIFQTMTGHHTTTLTSKIGNPAVFDSNSKARRLPRGAVFEASKRMEASGAFNQGAGLIKLSDNSGWAIVPKPEELDEQYRNYSGSLFGIKEGEASRAFEEVGIAVAEEQKTPVYVRITARGGISVSLPPKFSTSSDDDTSPTSSAGGSSVVSGIAGSSYLRSQDSDIASSVGSSFLDAMFRTPRKKDSDSLISESRRDAVNHNPRIPTANKFPCTSVIPCGMFVELERWISATEPDQQISKVEFARLRGGQGWIPRYVNGKTTLDVIVPPETRFGSFWFRVQNRNGIKVRLGPSKRAPSIKSEDGVYFRFECGEFLRASEIVTFFKEDTPSECFAKLYRNRHVRLYTGHGEVRPLSSLTVQAEWVQVFGDQELYLEECGTEPRIERHKQGWRYNVVLDARVQVRNGPSFEAEINPAVLLGGESVLVNERVTGPEDNITWLRLKDGKGWVHNIGANGEALMIPHALRHRKGPLGRPTKPGKEDQEDIAYNTIVARLFHNDLPESNATTGSPQRRRWN